jgi:hypothetical protein
MPQVMPQFVFIMALVMSIIPFSIWRWLHVDNLTIMIGVFAVVLMQVTLLGSFLSRFFLMIMSLMEILRFTVQTLGLF